jgi:uncharacterized protein (TIGR02145 family)
MSFNSGPGIALAHYFNMNNTFKYIWQWICFLGFMASCQQEIEPPVAACSAYPLIGDTTVWFEFEAGGSQTFRGFRAGLSFRWDYQADGVWDTEWRPESATTHCFIHPGNYKVVVEVADYQGVSDTASIKVESFGRNQKISTLHDPRDGKDYSIAQFRGYWWMRENLEYGAVIDLTQAQTNNGVVEQYYGFYPGSSDTVFGVYDWREAMNHNYFDPQGICPPGWHLPSISEWKLLLEGFPDRYAIVFYGRNGLSELNLQSGVYLPGSRPEVEYTLIPGQRKFWASDYEMKDYLHIYIGSFLLSQAEHGAFNEIWIGRWIMPELFSNPNLILGQAVRCIQKTSG